MTRWRPLVFVAVVLAPQLVGCGKAEPVVTPMPAGEKDLGTNEPGLIEREASPSNPQGQPRRVLCLRVGQGRVRFLLLSSLS
jgi:hypothetical protein